MTGVQTCALPILHISNYPGRTGDVQVNLYLCGDVIVGGDIMALGENGFQASLLYPAENT